MPASIYNIMIVIGLTSWMGTTRFVRAEFLSLREQDFVAAVRALGVGNLRIIFRHMMPNAIAPVLVSATLGIASAILTEAGLSFLGFGVPPPHATWGNILSDGQKLYLRRPLAHVYTGHRHPRGRTGVQPLRGRLARRAEPATAGAVRSVWPVEPVKPVGPVSPLSPLSRFNLFEMWWGTEYC